MPNRRDRKAAQRARLAGGGVQVVKDGVSAGQRSVQACGPPATDHAKRASWNGAVILPHARLCRWPVCRAGARVNDPPTERGAVFRSNGTEAFKEPTCVLEGNIDDNAIISCFLANLVDSEVDKREEESTVGEDDEEGKESAGPWSVDSSLSADESASSSDLSSLVSTFESMVVDVPGFDWDLWHCRDEKDVLLESLLRTALNDRGMSGMILSDWLNCEGLIKK